MRQKGWLWLLLLAAFWAQAGALAVGDVAPGYLGKGRKGEAVDLAQYRGKIVVVTFWASWCGPCRRELPVLDALQKQAGDDWLKIVAVNVEDSTGDYRAMLRQMRDFSLVQARDSNGDIAAAYDVKAYPNLWVVDPQGRVSSHHVGYGEESLQAIIEEIRRIMTGEIERQEAEPAAA